MYFLADGTPVAYDPRGPLTFFDVELDYYRSIQRCSFHCVANAEIGRIGRIGLSAALEVAYAMAHSRPIVVLHAPFVDPAAEVHDIIARNAGHVVVASVDELSLNLLEGIEGRPPPAYQISEPERSLIKRLIFQLFRSVARA